MFTTSIKNHKIKLYNSTNPTFLTLSDLAVYFKTIKLAIPSCLSNSGTVVKNRNTMSLVFIARYLMKSGLLNKTLTCLNSSFTLLSNHENLNLFSRSRILTPKVLHNLRASLLPLPQEYIVQNNTFSSLSNKLTSLKPVFHYYIYKVDKQIYKNSRGRSGKYTFLWKYITPFKRMNFIAFNLAKEIKVDYSKDLLARIINSVLKYINNIRTTKLARSIRFSNNYVFFGGKSNLLQNYRTIKSS